MSASACLFFLLLAAHALCDLPLQPARLSAAKRVGGDPALPWPVALGGHALIHGGAVAAVVLLVVQAQGSGGALGLAAALGAAETGAHALIDRLKCEGLLCPIGDQAWHLFCKLAWVAVVLGAG